MKLITILILIIVIIACTLSNKVTSSSLRTTIDTTEANNLQAVIAKKNILGMHIGRLGK